MGKAFKVNLPTIDLNGLQDNIKAKVAAARNVDPTQVECVLEYEFNNAAGNQKQAIKRLGGHAGVGMSNLEFRIDFGNLPPNNQMVARAVKLSLEKIDEAVASQVESGKNFQMHAALLAALMASYKDVDTLNLALEYALRRRIQIRITPAGWREKEIEPLEWRPFADQRRRNQSLRLNRKRVLSTDIVIGNNGNDLIFASNNDLQLKANIPESARSTLIGKPIESLINIPAYLGSGILIRGFSDNDAGRLRIFLKSPILNLPQIELEAARIQKQLAK